MTIKALRTAVGDVIEVVDVNITNIDLTDELERKIEEKMIAQQEAQRTVFTKQREQTQAEIVLIQARADAEAAQIRGEAITKNPLVLQMQIIEKWNGISPSVVMLGHDGAAGGNVILPITPATPQTEQPTPR
jgi:prohibitin 2